MYCWWTYCIGCLFIFFEALRECSTWSLSWVFSGLEKIGPGFRATGHYSEGGQCSTDTPLSSFYCLVFVFPSFKVPLSLEVYLGLFIQVDPQLLRSLRLCCADNRTILGSPSAALAPENRELEAQLLMEVQTLWAQLRAHSLLDRSKSLGDFLHSQFCFASSLFLSWVPQSHSCFSLQQFLNKSLASKLLS